MATAAPSEEPDDMECSVCHEHFKEPKVLPCGHLLCRTCLLSWLQSQPVALCPLCRCPIVENKDRDCGKSLEDTADSFVTDRAMAALVDAHRLLSRQHECCVCVNVAAVFVCMDCRDMFCQHCTAVHRKQSMSKHHAVEKLSSLTAEKLAAKCNRACAVHPDKSPEVFCPTHGVSVCLRCATTAHRQCPDVKDLEERVGEACVSLRGLSATLTARETEVGQGIRQLEQRLLEIDQHTKAAIADLATTFGRIEESARSRRRQLNDLLVKTSSDEKQTVKDQKNVQLGKLGKLTTHKRLVDRSEGMITRYDVTDTALQLETLVKDLDQSVSKRDTVKMAAGVKLVIDPEEVTRIQKALSELGGVKVIPADDSLSEEGAQGTLYGAKHGQQNTYTRGAPRRPRISLRMVTDYTYVEETFLVLPSNPQLDLSRGQISKEFLTIPDSRLQKECRAKYPKGIKYGQIAVTEKGSDYLPSVLHILHCCLPDKLDEEGLKKAVREVVTNSLTVADSFRYDADLTSIEFPALVLEDNRDKAQTVAETMYHALADYGNQHPKTTICDVYIALPINDEHLIDIFMAEDEIYRQAQMLRIARETEVPVDSVVERWSSPYGEVEVTKLKSTSEEYKTVKDAFMATILMDTHRTPRTDPSALFQIVSIEEIQNTQLLEQYENRSSQMITKFPSGFTFEKTPLWHGTSESAADEIIKYGFSKRFCKRPKFGEAVYFASTSNYSSSAKYAQSNARGERVVFYCRVLVGKCVQAEGGMRHTPPQGQAADFDCVVDDLKNPRIFAVYRDAQAYPAYKIVFKER